MVAYNTNRSRVGTLECRNAQNFISFLFIYFYSVRSSFHILRYGLRAPFYSHFSGFSFTLIKILAA